MDSASCTRLNLLDAQRVQKIREEEEIEIGKKGTMPRQKCDNARSLARPVAASRSLQREIMPSWQNCIVAARRFPLFCDSLDRSACLLLSPVSYRFTCFSGWGEGGGGGQNRLCSDGNGATMPRMIAFVC